MAAAGPVKATVPIQQMVRKPRVKPPPPKAHEQQVHNQENYSKLGQAGGPKKIDYFYLMEKYGPKRKFLKDAEPEKDIKADPVGFIVRFRLSDAYKAIERQEVEATAPKLKPYKPRRKRAHLIIQKANESNKELTDETKPLLEKSRKQQALERLQAKNQGKLLWKNLTQVKGPESVQNNDSQQRINNKTGKSDDRTKFKGAYDNSRPQSAKDKVKFQDEIGMSRKERLKLRKDSEKKIPGTKLFRTIMQHGGYGGGSLRSETTASGYTTDSSLTMDTMMKYVTAGSKYSSSVTMETVTNISDEDRILMRSSSGKKISAELRPSRLASDQPSRPTCGQSSKLTSGQPSRPSSGQSTSSQKSKDEKQQAFYQKGSSRKVEVLGGRVSEDGGDPQNRRASRRVSKYLYNMCNCRLVAKPDTLDKLIRKRKNNVAGVIEIYGCPDEKQESRIVCPFCEVYPKERILAWMDDIDSDEEPLHPRRF